MQARCVEDRRCSPALVRRADEAHAAMCRSQRELFGVIAEIDRNLLWKRDGARDMAHWLWMRYGLSEWKARRWIARPTPSGSLPAVSAAFARDHSGWTRSWSSAGSPRPRTRRPGGVGARVSAGAIRSRGDRESVRACRTFARSNGPGTCGGGTRTRDEPCVWKVAMPVAAGAVVMRALERVADQLPAVPVGDDPPGRGCPPGRRPGGARLCPDRLGRRPGPRDGGRARALGGARGSA